MYLFIVLQGAREVVNTIASAAAKLAKQRLWICSAWTQTPGETVEHTMNVKGNSVIERGVLKLFKEKYICSFHILSIVEPYPKASHRK